MRYINIDKPGGSEVLSIAEGEKPSVRSHEVLIRVKAAGVNRPDIMQRQGLYPMPDGVTHVPGLEIAGEVVAAGEDIDGSVIGKRVCALTEGGGYAEYCAVPFGQVIEMPDNISFIQGAAIPETFFTVWANLFGIGELGREETVLVHGGASGIGTTALSICKALNIRAISTVGSDEKKEFLREYGHIINYKKEDFEKAVLQHTDGGGVDVILDMVGASYFEKNLNVLKKDGRLVLIGVMGGRYADRVDLQKLMIKRIKVSGSTMRSRSPDEKRIIADELKKVILPVWSMNDCLPVIDRVFRFEDIRMAHDYLDAGSHIGKVVLDLEH